MGNNYKTKDLAEAGALILRGRKLMEIIREGRTCWFVFNDKNICQIISKDYFFGELLINAREYYEVINRLKNRIFALLN